MSGLSSCQTQCALGADTFTASRMDDDWSTHSARCSVPLHFGVAELTLQNAASGTRISSAASREMFWEHVRAVGQDQACVQRHDGAVTYCEDVNQRVDEGLVNTGGDATSQLS